MSAPKLRKAVRRKSPGLRVERALWADGFDLVVGMDEVGKGAWAGPLTIGAVVVPKDRRVYKIRDSKMLTAVEREALFDRIADWCEAWSVGHATHRECDELGMSDAQRLATRRALDGLGVTVDRILLDGNWDFVGDGRAQTIVRGDSISLSIAAASILAKVTRDRIMAAEAPNYPAYDFEYNKGYPCPRHRAALHAHGPSRLHRRSWAWMDDLRWTGIERRESAAARAAGAQGSLFE